MNRNETVDLLSAVAAYDNRTVGDTDVHAWHQAIGDMDFTAAVEAVPVWFGTRTTDVWTKPHHIRSTAHDIRRTRVEREHSQRILDDARALPAPGGQDPYDATSALTNACPGCGASAGARCVTPSGTERRTPCIARIKTDTGPDSCVRGEPSASETGSSGIGAPETVSDP